MPKGQVRLDFVLTHAITQRSFYWSNQKLYICKVKAKEDMEDCHNALHVGVYQVVEKGEKRITWQEPGHWL